MKGKKTGGRIKGTPNRVTAAREAEIAASGLTPLEHMLSVLRNPDADESRRDEMAKAAAPYCHPRLSQVESRNEHIHRYVARVPDKATNAQTWQQQHEPKHPTIQ